MVTLFKTNIKNNNFRFVYFDKDERVIKYPTNYLYSISRNNRYSFPSINHFANVIKYFCNFLEKEIALIDIDYSLRTIPGLYIDKYIKIMSFNNLEESTIRNRDAIIKIFMEWLTTEDAGRAREDSGYIGDKLKSVKPSRKIPQYVTSNELIDFLLCLHDEYQRCIIHFMFDTGLRVSEIPRMRVKHLPDLNDFPLEQHYFRLFVPGSKGGGGQIKPRYTFTTRAMVERINKLHKNNMTYMKMSIKEGEEMPLFLNLYGDPISKNAISNLIYRISTKEKLDIHPHKLRHGFAMSILASEYDGSLLNKMVILKETLGHNDIIATQIYSTIPPKIIEGLQREQRNNNINYRFEEAQEIFDRTYKPKKHHIEKRGRQRI